MRPVDGKAKSVRQLLQGMKYSIDYYQREYSWKAKQVRELLDDLYDAFLDDYEPDMVWDDLSDFTHYFLGSIIISEKNGESFIVDGQQRLTTLTLLLILLRTLQSSLKEDVRVNVDDLVFSQKLGRKTFNLAVEERTSCMEALYAGKDFNTTGSSVSVQNLHERYQDLDTHFPEELRDKALPFFTEWLIDHVHLVEITAYTDEDSYLIFETMNDRGLSLTPTAMLKGYMLANMQQGQRVRANELWRKTIQELGEIGDEHGADFVKTWLRSQHATSIRERRKGATPLDFDRIGTEFHRWLRDNRERLNLAGPTDFFDFVNRDFEFYSRQYLLIKKAASEPIDGLERIFYNSGLGFTLQDMLLLAPLRPEDTSATIKSKLSLVAHFVDILINWRIWNYRSISYSTMQYAMFLVVREIRGLDAERLAQLLYRSLDEESGKFHSNETLRLHGQNRHKLHRVLARMTDYVETQSGQLSRFREYVATGSHRYEIEHIWAFRPERHRDEFPHAADFSRNRNRIGGLLLLPRKFNASYGTLSYVEKLEHYNSQNLLARSLHPQTYKRNPGFLRFVKESGLPFRAHDQFMRADADLRSDLYRRLAERIWNPDELLREVAD